MKDIFLKVGQWCAVVLRAIGALLTKCENWIWRAEDRLPWIRNTYHAVRRFFQTIGSTLDAFCAKLVAPLIAKRKVHTEKSSSRFKIWADRIGSRLPKNKALFGTAVVEAILAVWGLLAGADILFILVILLWSAVFLYAAVKMEIGRFEKRTVDRMAQLISAMAIELFTIDRAVSDGLEISQMQANDYRAEAVAFLKDNHRIARLLDMVDE